MTGWVLVDYRQSILPRTEWAIDSVSQLRELLESFRDDDPGVYVLRSPVSYHFRIGISEYAGFVYWVDPPTKEILAFRPSQAITVESWYFRSEDVYEEMLPSVLIPVSTAIDLACGCFVVGGRPNGAEWRAI